MGSDPSVQPQARRARLDRPDLAARYGGGERSALERYVVIEEMLAAGAPVAAHWVADRQSGPLLLRYGTEEQRAALAAAHLSRRDLLLHRHERARLRLGPRVDPHARRARRRRLAPEWYASSGRATRSDSHYMIALCRTGDAAEDRHEGLSQLLVDARARRGSPSARSSTSPATTTSTRSSSTDAFSRRTADRRGGRRLGAGHGRARLRAKRPRALPLCHAAPRRARARPARQRGDRAAVEIGRQVAHLADAPRKCRWRRRPARRRARTRRSKRRVVKDLGGVYEQDLPEIAQSLVASEPRSDGRRRPRARARAPHAERALVLAARRDARDPARHHRARSGAPVSAADDDRARGRGTRDALRAPRRDRRPALRAEVTHDRIVAAERGEWLGPLWDAVEDDGLLAPASAGGRRGRGRGVARGVRRRAGGRPSLRSAADRRDADRRLAPRRGPVSRSRRSARARSAAASGDGAPRGRIEATLARVPWGRHAANAVVVGPDGRGDAGRVRTSRGRRGARGARTSRSSRATTSVSRSRRRSARRISRRMPCPALGALFRAAQMAGALEALLDLAVAYANDRVQFGRPIGQVPDHPAGARASRRAGGGGGYRGRGRLSRRRRSARPCRRDRSCRRSDLRDRLREGGGRARPPSRAAHRPSGARRDRLHLRALAPLREPPALVLAERVRNHRGVGRATRRVRPRRGRGRPLAERHLALSGPGLSSSERPGRSQGVTFR